MREEYRLSENKSYTSLNRARKMVGLMISCSWQCGIQRRRRSRSREPPWPLKPGQFLLSSSPISSPSVKYPTVPCSHTTHQVKSFQLSIYQLSHLGNQRHPCLKYVSCIGSIAEARSSYSQTYQMHFSKATVVGIATILPITLASPILEGRQNGVTCQTSSGSPLTGDVTSAINQLNGQGGDCSNTNDKASGKS